MLTPLQDVQTNGPEGLLTPQRVHPASPSDGHTSHTDTTMGPTA